MKKAILTAFILASITFTASCAAINETPNDDVPAPGLALQTEDTSDLPEEISYAEGRFLLAQSGSPMILIDNYGPCSMSGMTESVSFKGLTDGDLIKVSYQIVMESYPGQMPVYSVEKLADGEFEDLDSSTLASLAGMGWVDALRIFDNIQYIRTDGYHEHIEYPYLVKITSKAELDAYYAAFSEVFYLESRTNSYSDSTVGWIDATEKYDNAYFDKNILFMAVLEEGSGSIRHKVTGVENGYLTIESITPEVGTDDMAEWHILVESPIGMELWGVNGNNRIFSADQAIAEFANTN